MTVENENDLDSLKRIGKIVALTLREMKKSVRPGITTAELDEIGNQFLQKHGARSAPKLTYNFPGATCISVNDEAAHGIPGKRVVRPGDLVNIDVSAELDGYFADTAMTVLVPPISALKHKLCNCTKLARKKAIGSIRAGKPINSIGKIIEQTAHHYGFNVIPDLPSHGVGRSLHEEPTIPGFYMPSATGKFTEGLVITVEPFLSTGSGRIFASNDGWTLKSVDGGLSAQYEHTIVVTRGYPIIITQA